MVQPASRDRDHQARQVAERFHLLQNLRERIEQQLSRGRAIDVPCRAEADPEHDPVAAPATACSPCGKPDVALHRHLVKQARDDVKQAMFDRISALCDAGSP
ncbi:MAG: hypothetical protein ACRYGI_11155 [Janthinobacterium lividum]